MFEFDPDKSAINKEKHGIDFVQAQALWHDDGHFTIEARSESELRFLALGKIDSVLWAAIYTERGSNVRLISVRRARKDEVLLYDSQQEN